jgi:hypothetical protein
MRFELATEGIFAWLGRVIADQVTPTEQPRGPLILMLALGCWLIVALLVWAVLSVF